MAHYLILTVGGNWNHIKNKIIEKGNKMRKKEGPLLLKGIMETTIIATKGGAKSREAGDVEWYGESKVLYCRYKLLHENNGYKIIEGEQC